MLIQPPKRRLLGDGVARRNKIIYCMVEARGEEAMLQESKRRLSGHHPK